ncbi:major facilitator superfamily domain-containing protein [Aspergillus egyptiacus]|nr:major facilitator superfamily domain-containing protein [Aspergillus egyptiacus]
MDSQDPEKTIASDEAPNVDKDRATDGLDGVIDPQNWPRKRKITMISLVTLLTFNDSFASSIFAPVVSSIMDEFQTSSSVVSSLLISIHVIGLVAGPLVLAPPSEVYGRWPIIQLSNALFVVSAVLSAASVNVPMMLIARILLGLAGSVPMTISGSVITDLMPVQTRGGVVSCWSGVLVLVGPIIGGYMGMLVGWRWTFWLVTIMTGCLTIPCFFLMQETYLPVLVRRQQARNSPRWSQVLLPAATRPIRLAIQSPVIMLVSMYNSVGYVYLYFMITTFPQLFSHRYGFNPGEVGLAYIGQGVGSLLAQLSVGYFSNWCCSTRGQTPPLSVGCIVLGLGMIWYGWSAQAQAHWIMPIVASGVVGIGCMYLLVPVGLYIIDAFPAYAASGLAVNVVLRSVLGAFIPLSGPSLYGHWGYGWGNSVLGFIALALAPTTVWIRRHGEWLRTHASLQLD